MSLNGFGACAVVETHRHSLVGLLESLGQANKLTKHQKGSKMANPRRGLKTGFV